MIESSGIIREESDALGTKRLNCEASGNWKTMIFDCLSVPALVLKPSMIIVDVNACFLEIIGADKEYVVGKTCHDLFYHSPAPCAPEKCPLAMVLTDRRAHSFMERVEVDGGIERWEDRVLSPILDEAGEVLYVVECIHDVTPIKALERELSGAKDFAEKLVQSSTTAIIAADMAGRILMMNPAAEELMGYSLKEAQGKITAEDLYPPGQAKEVMRILRRGKGKLHLTTFTLINARGEEIPVDLTAAIIYEGERELATVGLFNDLREKLKQEQRAREMLIRIARAEKMASLGQLAAGVAHEINNPLTGILFYAHNVLETLDEDDLRRKSLECIYEDARRCGKIVKNLLAYSRQANPSKEILNVETIIESSLDLIRDRKFFTGIRIIKEFSGEMMLIEGDRDQLSQVIVNLVLNAVDAMDRKGTLTLRTYRDKLDQKACIEVSDTGHGIPKDRLPLIFDPFFTTKAPGKGTGLGLSTAYGILKESGGHIMVKETSERGTTFVVDLPLYLPPASGNLR